MTAIRHLTVKGELKKISEERLLPEQRASVPPVGKQRHLGGRRKETSLGNTEGRRRKKDWRKTRTHRRGGEWCAIPRMSRSDAGTCSRYSWIALKTWRTFRDLAGDALASEGPAVLQTSREGGGERRRRGCGGRWGHLRNPACVPLSSLSGVLCVPWRPLNVTSRASPESEPCLWEQPKCNVVVASGQPL